jgi:type II secretory pathway predicted ATPase ExeA
VESVDQDPYLTTDTSDQPPGRTSQRTVSSRRRALDRLRTAIAGGQSGPILITGEPGAGKTWLTHQLSCILPSTVVSVSVDVTRAMGALDFLQLIGHALGTPFSDSLGVARSRLNAALSDDAVDGKRWLLVVDEAHRAGSLIWDEIKAMVNHAGGAGGFEAIVVLGDTPLVRALAGRDFRGFASSLRVHVHLPPLDLDEARELLFEVGHDVDSLSNILEELHRDARGNPGRLLRLASGSLRSSSPGAVMGSNREALTAEQSPSRRFLARRRRP